MDETIGNLVGYPVLGVALILLWRLYMEVRKERDFWRDRALNRGEKLDDVLDTSEGLVEVGKHVRKRAKAVVEAPPDARQERLEQVVELLLRGAEE